ncbi:PP2C family protein-serine/threonine phosphatase [Georgenia sp. SUBG003]|uniref:PP2C family protein-serine/threonine phosphatase n=1 Tax=Georgenia sp. SUBG003 TaxID=1497974 RepID=UPI000693D544
MSAQGGDEQLQTLQRLLARSGTAVEALWMRYFQLGGTAGPVEVEAYVAGLGSLPALDRDVLAAAFNELLDEQAPPERVPYSRKVRQPTPQSGPLGALVSALAGMHLAPPERLTTVTAMAGEALGVQVVTYLVDYEQRRLHPVPGPFTGSREALGVDTSLAGRAFRTLETFSARTDGEARLWVPLLDGVERLGALEVVLGDPQDADDPAFRSHLTWLAALLGHLVTVTTQYGDGLDQVRRQQSRNAAAELVWQLLPPTTAGTDKVTVTGMIEPCYTVGGDAFDYALSETTAHLAIFDATGHSLDSGLITATALSAYRAARRDGRSLFDQAMAVDDVIGTDVQTGRLVTSVLAELDLATGRLRYISAGHPYPLVVRRGKVVKMLDKGRRPIFGLPTRDLAVAEEVLEPDDWLVLYTDGITEARGEDGSFFGADRLEGFLERETGAGHPPPEMVRRLVHRVMDHQQGVLQDDATVLVARWSDLTAQLTP